MKRESLDLLAQFYVLQLVLEMPATAVELGDRLLEYHTAGGIAAVRPLLRTLLTKGCIASAARDGVGRVYFITELGRGVLDNSRVLLDTMFHRRPAGTGCAIVPADGGRADVSPLVSPLIFASHAEVDGDSRARQSSRVGI